MALAFLERNLMGARIIENVSTKPLIFLIMAIALRRSDNLEWVSTSHRRRCSEYYRWHRQQHDILYSWWPWLVLLIIFSMRRRTYIYDDSSRYEVMKFENLHPQSHKRNFFTNWIIPKTGLQCSTTTASSANSRRNCTRPCQATNFAASNPAIP